MFLYLAEAARRGVLLWSSRGRRLFSLLTLSTMPWETIKLNDGTDFLPCIHFFLFILALRQATKSPVSLSGPGSSGTATALSAKSTRQSL